MLQRMEGLRWCSRSDHRPQRLTIHSTYLIRINEPADCKVTEPRVRVFDDRLLANEMLVQTGLRTQHGIGPSLLCVIWQHRLEVVFCGPLNVVSLYILGQRQHKTSM